MTTTDEVLRALLTAFRRHEDARRAGPGAVLAAASRERYLAGMRAWHSLPR